MRKKESTVEFPKPPATVTDRLCRNLKRILKRIKGILKRKTTANHAAHQLLQPQWSLQLLHYTSDFVSLQQLVSSDMALQAAVTVPVFTFAGGKGGELLCLSRCAQQFNFTALSQIRA